MKKKYKHKEIINQISKETGLNEQIIRLIIKKFYFGLKKTLLNNNEINIKGFFKIKLKTHYKNKLEVSINAIWIYWRTKNDLQDG